MLRNEEWHGLVCLKAVHPKNPMGNHDVQRENVVSDGITGFHPVGYFDSFPHYIPIYVTGCPS